MKMDNKENSLSLKVDSPEYTEDFWETIYFLWEEAEWEENPPWTR
jgi:hypothetical protein